MKSKFGVTEYYNNPKETRKAFEEGWFKTGDIVELIAQGTIRIIDRSNNFFKLSQGVFITPQKLEKLFCQSPLVSQVYVTCADLRKYQQNNVIAVIVPTENAKQSFKQEEELYQKVNHPQILFLLFSNERNRF